MALFPLKDILEGTKRLFVGIQAKDPNGVYKDVKLNADSEVVVASTALYVTDYFTGTAAVTRNFVEDKQGFNIVNDGTSLVSFTINAITIEVKPGESYEGRFKKFKTVTVSATGPFRAQVLA